MYRGSQQKLERVCSDKIQGSFASLFLQLYHCELAEILIDFLRQKLGMARNIE